MLARPFNLSMDHNSHLTELVFVNQTWLTLLKKLSEFTEYC